MYRYIYLYIGVLILLHIDKNIDFIMQTHTLHLYSALDHAESQQSIGAPDASSTAHRTTRSAGGLGSNCGCLGLFKHRSATLLDHGIDDGDVVLMIIFPSEDVHDQGMLMICTGAFT